MNPRHAFERDEVLPQAEFDRRLAQVLAELDGEEGDELRAQIAWFKRRYPTPTERIRFARRRYDAAMKMRGVLKNPR